jgi:anti-anti-sigma factor
MKSENMANPGVGLSAQTVGGVTIAELTGELDVATAPALREQLLCLLVPGSSRLVLDMSKLSFCDASGLAVLVSIWRRARLLGGFLRLAAVPPQLGRVLHVTELHRTFPMFPTVQGAARVAIARPRPASGHSGLPAAQHGEAASAAASA